MQFVSVSTLSIDPDKMPPPPIPVVSDPPEIVTFEMLVMKAASRKGLTSMTRSPPCVW
jgi:hypothetical protein